MRFRLRLAVELTVYFANHLVGNAFVGEVFLDLFGKVNQGYRFDCLALLNVFLFQLIFVGH